MRTRTRALVCTSRPLSHSVNGSRASASLQMRISRGVASRSVYGLGRSVTFKSHSSVAPSSGLFKVKVKDTLDGDSAAAVTAVGSCHPRSENPDQGHRHTAQEKTLDKIYQIHL